MLTKKNLYRVALIWTFLGPVVWVALLSLYGSFGVSMGTETVEIARNFLAGILSWPVFLASEFIALFYIFFYPTGGKHSKIWKTTLAISVLVLAGPMLFVGALCLGQGSGCGDSILGFGFLVPIGDLVLFVSLMSLSASEFLTKR